jgi:5-methylcytosine-specific restriction endonuclease McrA
MSYNKNNEETNSNKLRIKTIKNRAKITSDYERLGFYEIDRTIKKLKREKGKKKYFFMGKNIKLKTSTPKNNVFIKNYNKNNNICKCDICGIKASYFTLEKSPDNDRNVYHFNLYTVHPKTFQEVYFNIDHIKPRAKGGTNLLVNMQLTCEDCNSKKGDKFSKWSHLKSIMVKKIYKIFKKIKKR